MFERSSVDPIPTKRNPSPVSGQTIVQQRKNLFKDLVKGGMETQTLSVTDKYFRDTVSSKTWKKNSVTFPDVKQWENEQKWLTSPDHQGHEDTVRYLTFGFSFRLVDGTNKQYQTFHTTPYTYPTVWVCMCTRKCMVYYDISDKNTSPRDDHLVNTHKLENSAQSFSLCHPDLSVFYRCAKTSI